MSRPYDAHEAWLKREKRLVPRKQKTKLFSGVQTSKSQSTNKKKETTMSDSVFTFSFGPPPPPKPVFPKVSWDDVIGQAEAKAAVREAIEGASKHSELYKKYGRRPTKGVLLFGPPGNGKTMLGKAAVTAMAGLYGIKGDIPESAFIYVKPTEVMDPYLGGTEKKVRQLFAKARQHKQEHGYPAVIFIDEAESILGHRGGGRWWESLAVPSFLLEMDGMEDSAAFVLLATNRPNSLDSAIVREGRIDRKVFVGRPSRVDAKTFFEQVLRQKPIAEAAESLAEKAVEVLYNAKHVLYQVHLAEGGTKVATLGHFTSGAQIAHLVDTAASFAIDREIAGGDGEGINERDVVAAVERTLKEQRELEHPYDLYTFCEPFLKSVVEVERIRADGQRAKRSLIAEVPKAVEAVLERPGPKDFRAAS